MASRFYNFVWNEKSNLYARRFWILFITVIALIAFIRPADRTVTPVYSQAAQNWWNEEPLYSGTGDGFLYFPQSVFLYTPFIWQSFPEDRNAFRNEPISKTMFSHIRLRVAEALYRIVSVGLLGFGIWKISEALTIPGQKSIFFCVSLLSLPASMTAASNGQFNVLLAATFLLSTAAIVGRRWWWATFWLMLGLAAKPHGIIPILLFGVLIPSLGWRLMVGFAAFILIGFAHWNPAYVLDQWKGALHQIQTSTTPSANRYDDIAGMFRTFGVNLSDQFWFIVRAIFALITLWMAWVFRKHISNQLAPLLIAAAATAYMMIFNPRTESNTFVVVAPFIGCLAALSIRDGLKNWIPGLLIFFCIALGSDNYPFYDLTRIWWKPFITCLFFSLLLYWAIRKKTPFQSN